MKKKLMLMILGIGIGGNLIGSAAADDPCSCEYSYELCLAAYGKSIEQCRNEYQNCTTKESPSCEQ